MKDSSSGLTAKYYYDFTDRLMQYTETGTGLQHTVAYTYDDLNNLTGVTENINGEETTVSYTYDNDNRVISVVVGDVTKINEYDDWGRLISQETKKGSTVLKTDTYNYSSPTATTAGTQIVGMTTVVDLGQEGLCYPNDLYLSYDDNGNIIENANGANAYIYHYDSANQLVWQFDSWTNKTWCWTYDSRGNILTENSYSGYVDIPANGIPISTTEYHYTDPDWPDLLTGITRNGVYYPVTSDSIGNPLSDGTRTYTWQHGRQLATVTQAGVTWTNTYNADGLRVKRTNGTTTYNYIYNGSQLSQMTVGSNTLRFIYDANGTPMFLTYNGSVYFYVTNLQGDITEILDANGYPVVQYVYDPWGQLLSCTGSMAGTLGVHNPLRYRGYIYDSETGFYYVSSRYYDPEIGRWINADNQIAGVGGEVLGYNMFAYCMNNPVNMSDPSGNWPRWATIALGAVAAVAAVAVTVVTLGAAAPAAVCTLTSVAMSVGVSYGVASAAATVAVAATTVAAAAYAGDIAYSAVTGDSLLLDTVFQGNTDAYNTGLAITSIATAGMLEAAAQSPGVCFVAGTPVLAACGYIAIEEIKAGDMVWAENPETGEKELKEVVQTFVNETTELIYIQVGSEEIVTTPEHPFYSPVKGWIAACKLRAGDVLVLQSGKAIIVEKVQHEILETPITVYNFEVADFHTYYVGWSAVLVHNTCGGNSSSRGVGGKGWVGDKTWRENVSTVGNGGTITSLNGGVPTKAQAMQLINQSGGTPLRIEGAHQFPNPHNYTHINYVTSSGVKGTIKIFE